MSTALEQDNRKNLEGSREDVLEAVKEMYFTVSLSSISEMIKDSIRCALDEYFGKDNKDRCNPEWVHNYIYNNISILHLLTELHEKHLRYEHFENMVNKTS